MVWYAWVLIVTVALSALLTVSRVGQPRPPVDGSTAAGVVMVNGLFIWAIVSLAGGC